jgi:hypothetical protein
MSYADYSKNFLIDAKEFNVTFLPELFLKRGDAYADMRDFASAKREYDRVSAGFPKQAVYAFTYATGNAFASGGKKPLHLLAGQSLPHRAFLSEALDSDKTFRTCFTRVTGTGFI